ncbi:centrosomal protein of 57 kDa-like [Planoprotostelium fungivorum]|uniref:Centrosomal protein of 57 kDa-like n=1 Tax=Planoprotostelium fungivorum TaxID=1890364 RepID=A0A2P6NI84_9EUKA|nr:centrosomal protein of 57 kDa-like [Planoprotostelium fungivorum]
MSGGTPTGNSKAVLSALRSLQDKIKELEEERHRYQEEARSLRAQRERENQLREAERQREEHRLKKREDELLQYAKDLEELQIAHESNRSRNREIQRKESRKDKDIQLLKDQVELLQRELGLMREKAHSLDVENNQTKRQMEIMKMEAKKRGDTVMEPERTSRTPVRSPDSRGKKRILSPNRDTRSTSSFKDNASDDVEDQHRRSNDMPFVVGKSVSKSFHMPSNVQQALNLIQVHAQTQQERTESRRGPKKVLPRPCSKVWQPNCATSGIPNEDSLEVDDDAEDVKRSEEFTRIIKDLESEYDDLNQEYQKLILKVSADTKASNHMDSTLLNSKIQQVIERLGAKAKQIQQIKMASSELRNTRGRAFPKSPVFDGKHMKAMKLLHHLQRVNKENR